MFIPSLALKLLLRKIDRTAITILMLVPVIALVIGANSLVTGYVSTAAQTKLSVASYSSHNQYIVYGSSVNSSRFDYSRFLEMNSTTGVSRAIPFLILSGELLSSSGNHNVSIVGTDTSSFLKLKSPQIIGNTSSGNLTIGAILAKILNLKIGQAVQLSVFSQAHSFTISNVMNSSSPYDVMIVLPLTAVWSTWPESNHSITDVEFQTSNEQALSAAVGGLYILQERDLSQIVNSFSQQTSSLVSVWTIMLLALSAAVSVVASIRVASGSTQEFKVLRGIGAKLSLARSLLVWEHLLVSLIAVMIGVSAGVVATRIIATFLNPLLGTTVSAGIDLFQISILSGLAFLLIFLGGMATVLRFSEKAFVSAMEN